MVLVFIYAFNSYTSHATSSFVFLWPILFIFDLLETVQMERKVEVT